jgi:hypothetical protein
MSLTDPGKPAITGGEMPSQTFVIGFEREQKKILSKH